MGARTIVTVAPMRHQLLWYRLVDRKAFNSKEISTKSSISYCRPFSFQKRMFEPFEVGENSNPRGCHESHVSVCGFLWGSRLKRSPVESSKRRDPFCAALRGQNSSFEGILVSRFNWIVSHCQRFQWLLGYSVIQHHLGN